MFISIDTEKPLSEVDLTVLRALAGTTAAIPAEVTSETKETAVEEEEQPKRRTRRTRAQIEADEAAKKTKNQEVDEENEDLVGGDEDEAEEGLTLPDVVRLASKVLAAGKRSEMRTILEEFKIKKVSELKPTQISKFHAALSEIDLDD